MRKNVTFCDRCKNQAEDKYGRTSVTKYTRHGHPDHQFDLCQLCHDALHVWLDGASLCFNEERELAIADELKPSQGFPHKRNSDGVIV